MKRLFFLLFSLSLLLTACSNPTVVTTTSSDDTVTYSDSVRYYHEDWPEGERWDEHVIHYDGRGIEMKWETYFYEPIDVMLVVFIDGRIVPSSVDGGTLEDVHYFEMEPDILRTMTIFCNPDHIDAQSDATMTIFTVPDYRNITNSPSYAYLDGNFLISGIPIIVEDSVSKKQDRTKEGLVRFAELPFPSYQSGFSNDVTSTSNVSSLFTLSEPPADGLFYVGYAPCDGEFTSIIFVDGQPIDAFGGKRYLDWGCSGDFNRSISVRIDDEALPSDGLHNVFALTVNRSEPYFGDYIQQRTLTLDYDGSAAALLGENDVAALPKEGRP